jgi:hypothetical protein
MAKISVQLQSSRQIEKSIQGRKSKYLVGVASGIDEDAHGEHLTPNCIASLVKQAQEGDVLLFADVHGIKESEDIGIMTDFKVLPNKDWEVEFRLYDESDGVGRDCLDKINKLWAQLNGLPPYTQPRQKGFSIEGFIPDNQVLQYKKQQHGQIDDMVLEGVVVVPRPAYQNSVVQAIQKSVDEIRLGDELELNTIELANKYFTIIKEGFINGLSDDELKSVLEVYGESMIMRGSSYSIDRLADTVSEDIGGNIMKKKVNKALSPSEQSTIGSVIGMLNNLQEGLSNEEEVDVEMSAESTIGEDSERENTGGSDNFVEKDETANSDAEERLEEMPDHIEIMKEALEKCGYKVTKTAKPVYRSSDLVSAIHSMAKVAKSLSRRLDEQEETIQAVISGEHVTKGLLSVEKAAPRQAVQPSSNHIIQALAKEVARVNKSEHVAPTNEGLGDVLCTLLGGE